MTTVLWEGDGEPALLVRIDGVEPGFDLREALEGEVPRFQDLLAVELSRTPTSAGWTTHWLLASRAQEESLRTAPERWDLLAAGLVSWNQGTVVVAPEADGNWTVVVKEHGRMLSIRKIAPGDLRSLKEGPFVVVLPDTSVGRRETWKATGLPARLLPRAAVVGSARPRMERLFEQARDEDFPIVRLAPSATKGRLLATFAVLVVAANLLLSSGAFDAPEPVTAEVQVVPEAPRPSAVLANLAHAVPDLTLREFRMTGDSWRLDLQTRSGVAALEALKKIVAGLKVVQFQTAGGSSRLVVEGEGYP